MQLGRNARSASADLLLERETELHAIGAAVSSARSGRGAMVVVAGPGGIGKSRLLARGREVAEAEGLRVLTARCSELERSFPFGAARQLFEPLLLGAGGERGELFGGAAALAAPLFEEAVVSVDEDTLFSRLHGLHWLAANVAARDPLLLAVDDAHWADEASLRFLSFLAHRIGDLPTVLLVGSRPLDDPTADPAVGALLTDPEAVQLRPAPLSQAAITTLLDSGDETPDAAFVAACHEATGGNPFLIGELVVAIAEEGLSPRGEAVDRLRTLGPAGIAAVILLRLRRLSTAAIELARALAILGDGVEPRTAGAFAGLAEADAVEAARVLEAAGVADAEEGLRFVHPIVRQSVYQDMTSIERGEGHAAAARFLVERGATADAVAAHLLHAPPRGDAETVTALRAAAARAEGLGDPIAAAEQLRRALAEPPPAETLPAILFALGRASARAGLTDASAHLEACLALRPAPDIYVPAAGFLAELRQFSGRADLAVDVLERGIAEIGEDTDAGRRLVAHLVGPAHVSVSARRRVLPRLERLADPGRPARTPEELVALAALSGAAVMDRNEGALGADLARRALAGLPDAPDAATRAAVVVLVVTLMGAEEHAASDALATTLVDRARAAGERATMTSIMLLRALVRFRHGRVASAESDALYGLELLPEAHGAEMLANAGAAAAVLAGIERERPPASLREVLDGAPYHRDPEILPYSQILLARGTLHQAEGQHEAAVERFEACDRPGTPGWASDTPSMVWWRSGAALSLSALGRDDDARSLAAEELRLARESRLPRCTGIAERAVALVGPEAARVPGLLAAVTTLESTDAPLELARALADLGAAQRRAGDRTAARDALARAHETAERVGATRLAGVARQELRALGARPKSTAGYGVAGLTPAERRVAELAAGGRTNREIAQSLFVSEKTVETHLARVFRKLNVRSRRQLPDLLPATA